MAVFNSYIGKSTDLTVTNNALLKNPRPEAYNLLTSNISMDTAKLWGVGKPDKSLVSIYMDNLLNKQVYTPNLNYINGTNTIPQYWGRSVNVTYTYKF